MPSPHNTLYTTKPQPSSSSPVVYIPTKRTQLLQIGITSNNTYSLIICRITPKPSPRRHRSETTYSLVHSIDAEPTPTSVIIDQRQLLKTCPFHDPTLLPRRSSIRDDARPRPFHRSRENNNFGHHQSETTLSLSTPSVPSQRVRSTDSTYENRQGVRRFTDRVFAKAVHFHKRPKTSSTFATISAINVPIFCSYYIQFIFASLVKEHWLTWN